MISAWADKNSISSNKWSRSSKHTAITGLSVDDEQDSSSAFPLYEYHIIERSLEELEQRGPSLIVYTPSDAKCSYCGRVLGQHTFAS